MIVKQIYRKEGDGSRNLQFQNESEWCSSYKFIGKKEIASENCYSRIEQNGDRHTNLKGKERLQLKTAIPELNQNGDSHTKLKGKERLELKTAIPELNQNGDRHTNL